MKHLILSLKNFAKKLERPSLFLVFILLTSNLCSAQKRWLVKADSSLANDGNSWATACSFLYALRHAGAGDEIWLKRGRYMLHNYGAYKNATDIVPALAAKLPSRELTFNIPSKVKVYGGFLGAETLLSQRPLPKPTFALTISMRPLEHYDENVTLLDGFLYNQTLSNGTAPVGVRHTIVFDHVRSGTLLDGCVIINGDFSQNGIEMDPDTKKYNEGWAKGIWNNGRDGDSSNVTINGCYFYKIQDNNAGGQTIYNNGSGGKATIRITNCQFIYNNGFGVHNGSSAGGFYGADCFSGNALSNGARMVNYYGWGELIDDGPGEAYATMINCKINNYGTNFFPGTEVITVARDAGAIAHTSIINCEFSNCWANPARELASGTGYTPTSIISTVGAGASNTIVNTVAYNNRMILDSDQPKDLRKTVAIDMEGGQTTLSYVMTEAGLYDPSNLINPLDTDKHLKFITEWTAAGTPAPSQDDLRNYGNTQAYLDAGGPATDMYGNPRITGGVIDLGVAETICPVRIYVNAAATGTNNGITWENAFTDLQSALNFECQTDLKEIWVAAGTYIPTTVMNQEASFVLPSGVKIYGGFDGTETLLSERNPSEHETILSGKFDEAPVHNSYHVVRFDHVSAQTQLDGFTIRDGRAGGPTGPYYHRGGGIYIDGSGSGLSSVPVISNCRIMSNQTTGGGGAGIYNDGSNGGNASPTLINCLIASNGVLSGGHGGAMYNYGNSGNASPTLINCTITGNTAGENLTGGIYNEGTANPVLTNSILWGHGGGSFADGISGGNPVSTYSIVQGGANSNNHVSASDPVFVSNTYYQSKTSPAVDGGNPASYLASFSQKDLAGNARVLNARIDIGAFEIDNSTALPVRLVRFQAGRYSDNIIGLDWETSFEQNSALFEVQRSNDAKEFATLGIVQAMGETTQKSHYQFLDEKPLNQTAYYRLKMADLDGSFAYSRLISIDPGNLLPVLRVIENPATSGSIRLWLAGFETSELQLINLNGQHINASVIRQADGSVQLTVETQLLAGVYVLTAANEKERQSVKVVIP